MLNTRRPTGATPWPLVLIEGSEKSGKSWAAAEFTKSEQIGPVYWLDLGEGAADEYAAIPGAKYDVIVHDGTWGQILAQVLAVNTEAQKAVEGGEKPVVLVVDSMTAEWDMLKDWVSQRARNAKYAKKILDRDPDAEIKPSMNLWNDANDRHSLLMRILMTFPGIVILTARGKSVASMDDKGQPIPNAKDYRVEGHKTLAYDATAWVRLSRTEPPEVVGVRSVHSGLRPGVDKPVTVADFSIEWLVFDLLKCGADTKPRQLQVKPPFEDVLAQAEAATEREQISAAWKLAKDADYIDQQYADGITIRELLTAAVERVKAEESGRYDDMMSGEEQALAGPK